MKRYFLVSLFLISFLSTLLLVFNSKSPASLFENKTQKSDRKSSNSFMAEEKIDKSRVFSTTSQSQDFEGALEVGEYKVLWSMLKNPGKLSLHTNLKEKLSSSEAFKRYNCSSLISGGFFSESGHIGLFVMEGKILEKPIRNPTFNGFFIADDYFLITKTPPKPSNIRLAIQSGPVLVWEGEPQNLKLTKDENARRIVVGTTLDKKEVVFLSFFNKNNSLLGPKLSELPRIISDMKKKFSLDTALNLDGGTHSAFLSNSGSVFEVTTIGSFFCLKS